MDYNIIKKMMLDASNIVITAHKNIDFDAFGSMIGLYYISQLFDKETYLVCDDENMSHEIKKAIEILNNKENVNISSYKDISKKVNSNTLLIILDVNNKKRIQNEKLLQIKNKIVLDHHITSDNSIDAEYLYNNTDVSSTIEIVLELIEKLNAYVPSTAAVIMLAGIYIDTHGFIKNTTDKTHYYTSLLYKFGIDLKEAQEFIKQDFNEYKRRKELVMSATINDDIAIACTNEIYNPYEIAMVSDELLVFDKVKASFTIAMLDDKYVGISARSLGNINVEKIMKLFGGGGHEHEAAAQVKGNVEDVKNKIISYWRNANESNIFKGC